MEFTHKFLLNEQKCERKTIAALKGILSFNDELLNFYFNFYKKLSNFDENVSLQDLSIILIHIKMIKTYYCLSDLLKKGHYCEFQSLQRDVFELAYLSEYLIKNPDMVDPWFCGEQINHSHVANNLDIPNGIRKLYGMMCDYTHPNIKGARGNLILGQSDFIGFQETPEFHKSTAYALMAIQITFMYGAIELFYNHFKKFGVFDQDTEKQMKLKLNKKISYWIKFSEKSEDKIFPIQ
jgi:hypothetical protein